MTAQADTFRKSYRELSEEEKNLLNAIKSAADDLLTHVEKAPDGRSKSLAITKLEESVMWAVKGITG